MDDSFGDYRAIVTAYILDSDKATPDIHPGSLRELLYCVRPFHRNRVSLIAYYSKFGLSKSNPLGVGQTHCPLLHKVGVFII